MRKMRSVRDSVRKAIKEKGRGSAQKITRSAFLYLEPREEDDDDFAQCEDCFAFRNSKCSVMGNRKVSGSQGSCGFFVHIARGSVPAEYLAGNLSPAETGYVERPVRCENCYYGEDGTCELFDLDERIKPFGCCNAQTARNE
jgi:hypothetical protein